MNTHYTPDYRLHPWILGGGQREESEKWIQTTSLDPGGQREENEKWIQTTHLDPGVGGGAEGGE